MSKASDSQASPACADRPRWLTASVALLALVVFPLLCLRYATSLSLWGDEAYSLLQAAGRRCGSGA